MTEPTRLRVQVRVDVSAKSRVRVEVLDPAGNVLGDLASIVPYDGIEYRLSDGVSILKVEFVVERASIDALEVAGYNIEAQQTTVKLSRGSS